MRSNNIKVNKNTFLKKENTHIYYTYQPVQHGYFVYTLSVILRFEFKHCSQQAEQPQIRIDFQNVVKQCSFI